MDRDATSRAIESGTGSSSRSPSSLDHLERIAGIGRDRLLLEESDVALDRIGRRDHAVERVVPDPLEDPRSQPGNRRGDEHEQRQPDRRGPVVAEAAERDEDARHLSSPAPGARR